MWRKREKIRFFSYFFKINYKQFFLNDQPFLADLFLVAVQIVVGAELAHHLQLEVVRVHLKIRVFEKCLKEIIEL